MKFAHLKALGLALALSSAMVGAAQAQVVGGTSDSSKVTIAASTVVGGPHTAGKVGIHVPNLDPGEYVDFQGLQSVLGTDANGVTTFTAVTGTVTDHSQYGRFDFAKVSGYDIYFGEWKQTASVTAGDHTVYYGGTGASTSVPSSGSASYSVSRYCDQPMSWGTRLFGFAGTTSIIGLVLAAALFTWKAVYQPIRSTSQPLTVVELQPLAAPPEPVRNVAPGPEQVEKREAEPEPVPEPMPMPLVQLPAPSTPAREVRKPMEITDPGPAVPETTAPKSVAAPAARQLSNNARPDWEGLILAHLERFRRYPTRARAARQQGTVTVRFKVNRAGIVLSSSIVTKSGSFDLDRAALDTLQRAQPLPAIPADRPDIVELTIPVEFYLAR